MKHLFVFLLILLSLCNVTFAADNKVCAIAIKNADNYMPDDGDTEYMSLSLEALRVCATQGNKNLVNLASLMQAACQQSSNQRANRIGLCYLSAARVIGLSL